MVLLESNDPFYSMTVQGGYVLEHRLLMAQAFGRPLADHESVHHIDGDRLNNTLSNLQLPQGKHGPGVIYIVPIVAPSMLWHRRLPALQTTGEVYRSQVMTMPCLSQPLRTTSTTMR